MRSWSSRPETTVSDEPLYAHYLSTLPPEKRATHPGADAVMRSQPTDWRTVAAALTGPCDTPVWYQKHMAHHLTDAMLASPDGLDWTATLTNVFLIRDPAEMITSFIKVIPDPTPEDLGLPQQVRLFDRLRERTGEAPPVFTARDILEEPRAGLSAMCASVGLRFDNAMLAWPEGPHPSDGVWAPHWYASVNASTGFTPWNPKNEHVPKRLAGVLDDCRRLYDSLASFRAMP